MSVRVDVNIDGGDAVYDELVSRESQLPPGTVIRKVRMPEDLAGRRLAAVSATAKGGTTGEEVRRGVLVFRGEQPAMSGVEEDVDQAVGVVVGRLCYGDEVNDRDVAYNITEAVTLVSAEARRIAEGRRGRLRRRQRPSAAIGHASEHRRE